MSTKQSVGPLALLACLAVLMSTSCGKSDSSPATASETRAITAEAVPFIYPATVSGHFSEVNTGDFDLVDGIAFPASAGGGTVVYVTSKAIASPALTGAASPMTDARAIALLRDAQYLEVTLDAAGKSSYFAYGAQLGGRGREEDSGGKYWKIELKKPVAGHTAARVVHKDHGSFEFDLPLAKPKVTEVSEGDRVQGRRAPEDAPTASDAAVVELYRALSKAAKQKDLAAFLAAQKFSAAEIAAIRGLAGIDADFAVFADRFLSPGEAGEATVYQGYAGIGAKGVNSKGAKFSNYYEFAPSGERLVLIGISESPE